MQHPLRIFIDNWSYLDFKSTFGFRNHVSQQLIPGWVGWHYRRIQAYTILESYYRNVARLWLEIDEEAKYNRREYGDPATVVDQIMASLLGDRQHISILDAEGESPDTAAQEQLDVLNNWAKDERFYQKMIECERNACKLGDGVYVLGWSDKVKRPRLRVYNPGFYFPVLDPAGDPETDDWPKKVHIAYEYDLPNEYDTARMLRAVRRITWELRDIPEEEASRNYPWNTEPSRESVYYTDATFYLEAGSFDIAMEIPTNARYTAQDEDLAIDFIPIVHIPCQVAEEDHFGRSVLSPVLQVFDDLVSTDTDLQAASATTGTPPIALSGASAPKDEHGQIKSYGPGTIWETGDGTATVVDTSHSLDALLDYGKQLKSRVATNSHVPEALLGTIKPNEVPSGIAITLSFAPHTSMIREMRLVRDQKYALLMKFVSRFFMKNDDIADVFDANVVFGSFLPADKQEALTLVQGLLAGKAISPETAIKILMMAGFPIEDASEELRLIQENDFTGANELLNATGDAEAVREYLGLPALPAEMLAPPAPGNLPPGPPPPAPPGLPSGGPAPPAPPQPAG